MENLKPNGKRAKTVIFILWILLGLQFISLVSQYFQYDMYTQYDYEEASISEITAGDTREMILSLLYIAAYITCIITFIQWFRRAYFNLHTRVDNLSYSEGWAAGSWFIPILNWFRPFQIMKELYDETDILLTRKLSNYRNRLSSNVVGIWWTLWLISSLVDKISYRYSMNAYSVEGMKTALIVGMIGLIIAMPLTLLAIKVIKDYSKIEPLMTEVNSEVDEFGMSSLNPQPIY